MSGTLPGLRWNVESVAERWSDMGREGRGGKFLSQLHQVTPRHASTLDGHFWEAWIGTKSWSAKKRAFFSLYGITCWGLT